MYVNESYADCIWEELIITNVCDCKRVMKQHEGVCPFTSIIKDQTAKTRSLGIKCVSLVDIVVVVVVYFIYPWIVE